MRRDGRTSIVFALSVLTTASADTISYRNTGLVSGTTYRYRVRANTSVGYSVYSNTAGAAAR